MAQFDHHGKFVIVGHGGPPVLGGFQLPVPAAIHLGRPLGRPLALGGFQLPAAVHRAILPGPKPPPPLVNMDKKGVLRYAGTNWRCDNCWWGRHCSGCKLNHPGHSTQCKKLWGRHHCPDGRYCPLHKSGRCPFHVHPPPKQ